MDNYGFNLGQFDPNRFYSTVCVIGCGGLGGMVSQVLIRTDVGREGQSPIRLYDGDCFQEHNTVNQWVDTEHMFCRKVSAVRDQMLAIRPEAEIYAHHGYIDGTHESLSGVVFICVDSMSVRKKIVDGLAGNTNVKCVIEIRMDAGGGASHCFNPNSPHQIACWKMEWCSDEEVENLAGCSGASPAMTSVLGATHLAMCQFEAYAYRMSTEIRHNRLYHDYHSHVIRHETWPVC